MYERKTDSQRVCNGGSSFGSTCIRADNDTIFEIRNFLLNVLLEQWPPIQVVNGYVEETLILRVVKVHSNDVVGAGASKKISNKCAGLCNPLSVAWTRLECVLYMLGL